MNEKIVRPEFMARGPRAVANLPEKRDPHRAQLRIDIDSDFTLLMRHLKIAREMLQDCERVAQRCRQSGLDPESERCARDQIQALFKITSRALNSRPRD